MGTYVTKVCKASQTNFLSKVNHDCSTPHSSLQNLKFAYLSQRHKFLPNNNCHPLTNRQKQNQNKSKQTEALLPWVFLLNSHYQILSVQDVLNVPYLILLTTSTYFSETTCYQVVEWMLNECYHSKDTEAKLKH